MTIRFHISSSLRNQHLKPYPKIDPIVRSQALILALRNCYANYNLWPEHFECSVADAWRKGIKIPSYVAPEDPDGNDLYYDNITVMDDWFNVEDERARLMGE